MPSSPSRPVEQRSGQVAGRKRIALLSASPLAHRGLHGRGRVENSRAAFAAAIRKGHGIELDVQASQDGHAFVFHDYELDRLTDETGPVAERTSAELQCIRLKGSKETIPTLPEVLELVASQVPILIEIKAAHRHVTALCLSVLRALEGYRGPVGVMSFNPEVTRWFALHAPRITRGLVVTESEKGRLRGWIERRFALWRARPDFLAYDVRDFPSRFATSARRRGLPIFTWTVRNAKQAKIGRTNADQIIYEAA
jgi:glycerophosphoryl diester phosphodiesterase